MAHLTLQRRHVKKCKGKHSARSWSYKTDERERGWKRCFCPIYAGGTLDKFDRRDTGKGTWEEAEIVQARWEACRSWAGALGAPVPAGPGVQAIPPTDGKVTIQAAAEAYIANRAGRGIAGSTLRKYNLLVKQLREFAVTKGYVMLDQFTVPDMDLFYVSWKDGVRARGKKLERLKGFFKFCVTRDWLAKNPARALEAPVGAATAANKNPFTDAELTRIYDACDRLPVTEWTSGSRCGVWSGEDVKTFIMLLSWTGLRISDGATFDMSRVTRHPKGGASIFLRMHKTNGALSTWVDDWLYERLLARERKYGSRVFAVGESRRLETMTDLWRRRINRVFDVAGKFECGRPTPHIFRHTFARLLLQRGVSIAKVAILIGDTEQMVDKHYAKWVPERQEDLTDTLREKLRDAPRPKLVVLPGGKAGTEHSGT